MISVRVKTQSLEVAVSSPNDTLADVVKATISVAESQPVQNSLNSPIIIRALDSPVEKSRQLPLMDAAEIQKPQEAKRKKLPDGKGEKAIAYNKTRELIGRGFFDNGTGMKDIRQELSKIGYPISANKLADALLDLVRENLLVREGERGSYTYKKP